MTDVQHDYIAFASVGAGGTWTRGSDPREVLARCKRAVKQDWSHLFKIPQTFTLNLYDVSGHDEVHIGDNGAWAGDVRCPQLGSVVV